GPARPQRASRRRRPPREDPARPRRGEPPQRPFARDRVRGRRHPVRPRHASRQHQRLRPEQRARCAAGRDGRDLVEPRLHVRRRFDGRSRSRMTDQLTRRQLLERAALGGAAITVPGLLAACGGTSTKAGGGGTTVAHKLAKTLHFSNWTLYIDNKPGGRHPSLDQFQKKYGVKVAYTEDINDNASFFSKIQPALSSGQSTGRDLIVMTDNSRYPSLLIKKGWVEKLDKSVIPNIKNLIPQQQHPNWDPNRDYSLPWQSGMTGIGYNEKLTDPVLSMSELLGNKKLKGKVGLLSEFADTLALVMAANGDDPSKIAAEIEDYVNYICPVQGAKQALQKIDPSVANNTLIFPTKKMLDNVHIIDASALNNQKYQTTWQNLISA